MNTIGYNKAKDALVKRKEQVDKANGVSANARGGRGGRGGAVTRGGGSRTMARSYQSGMQTVSFDVGYFYNWKEC